jgi:hypothetical protein
MEPLAASRGPPGEGHHGDGRAKTPKGDRRDNSLLAGSRTWAGSDHCLSVIVSFHLGGAKLLVHFPGCLREDPPGLEERLEVG